MVDLTYSHGFLLYLTGIIHLANSLHKDLNTLARPKSEDGQEKDIRKLHLFMWMVRLLHFLIIITRKESNAYLFLLFVN